MGKGTDKLYITHSEWSGEFGAGHSAAGSGRLKSGSQAHFARLPFDHCALSLKPFDIPMGTENGTVYDLVNILPFLKQHGIDPVTGEKMSAKDLIRLNFHRNEATGEYADPLTFKPFTSHTPLVAIKTSGNVFAKDTVDRLNVKANFWRDLVSDEAFTRKDIIVLQDPHNVDHRDTSQFHHLTHELTAEPETEAPSLSGINVGAVGGAAAQLRQIASSSSATLPASAKGKEKAEPAKQAPKKTSNGKTVEPYNAAVWSTGRAAASLTSTSYAPSTKSERALIDEEEFMFEQIKDKGYVRLITNFGNINVELHCDKAPRTSYNFIQLAKFGKYQNVAFHRRAFPLQRFLTHPVVPGFCLQGGDPTGTGKGGESIWGKPFADEFMVRNAYRHDARGIISMANHGPHTNGSQFFILFAPRPNLDGKHTVFGRIVGGMDILQKMEMVPAVRATEKPQRQIMLVDVQVFTDPFEIWRKKLEKRLKREADERDDSGELAKKREEREKDRTNWFGVQLGEKVASNLKPVDPKLAREAEAAAQAKATAAAPIVGRYLEKPAPIKSAPEAASDPPPPTKKRKNGFGDFSGW